MLIRCGEIGTIASCWWKQHDVATVDDSMALPQKAKHELPHELDIPLLGIFPRIKEIFLHPCS